jgi:hypothetical protein
MDQPIACTLTADQSRARADDLAALAARSLRARERTAQGERLTFADSPGTERELRAVIAAEARCCSFLRMDVRRADGSLVLDIAGPQDARPVIAKLFA